jgi:MFS family permease
LRYRGQYFGILSAMWSLGSVAGPILGGGFAENVTWVGWMVVSSRFSTQC